jgi:hypothetical protein
MITDDKEVNSLVTTLLADHLAAFVEQGSDLGCSCLDRGGDYSVCQCNNISSASNGYWRTGIPTSRHVGCDAIRSHGRDKEAKE